MMPSRSGLGPHETALGFQAQAAQWAAAGRPDHAAHLYGASLDLEPHDVRVRMMLADCLVRCNQPVDAAAHYLRAAQDYIARRREREALALCYQVLHLDSSQIVYVAVANMLRRVGREARTLCARAAEAHMGAGRLADGLNMMRLGAELDARNPDIRRRLAQVYLSQHMVSDAVTQLAEAGRLLMAAGNNAEYVEVAELLLRHDGRHLQTLRDLPRVYLRVGEPQRAVVVLSDLMRVSPGDAVGFEILAQAFTTIGRIPTALSILQRLTTELRTTGRAAAADAIIERARGWRLDDLQFIRSVLALRNPPAKAPPKPRAKRPTTSEGTVVLDIADLMEAEGMPEDTDVLDLSDVVEIADGEGSVVVRLEDFSIVEPVPKPPRAVLPPPIGARRRSTPPPPPRRRAAPPSRATKQEEATQIVDLSEIEIAQDTTSRPHGHGRVSAMVHDEESSELRASRGSGSGLSSVYRGWTYYDVRA